MEHPTDTSADSTRTDSPAAAAIAETDRNAADAAADDDSTAESDSRAAQVGISGPSIQSTGAGTKAPSVELFDTPETDEAATPASRSTPAPAASTPAQPDATGETRTAAPAATPSTAQSSSQQSTPQWKIQPLPGDPPLTLYRDKRMVTLQPGAEVDRYGEPSGNVTYAARTLYQHRSLPADWIHFPYHVYRLQRPLEALTGLAVPWFHQPGGGTAYVLPKSIAELIADGSLVEVEASVGPPSS